jgi:DNA-binding response OmpR family regulator
VITFPQAQSQAPLETGGSTSAAKHVPIRFLLIDDEVNILRAVEMYFENTEIDIATAQTARDGLSAIKTNTFDVILCDLSMNEMNGLEVGKWVGDYCRRRGMAKIPFLLYTGLDKQLDAVKLKEAGIDRVVNKPAPCEDLRQIIREMVTPE